MPEKGVFTSDLTHLLQSGAAELVVHSWKGLPLGSRRAETGLGRVISSRLACVDLARIRQRLDDRTTAGSGRSPARS